MKASTLLLLVAAIFLALFIAAIAANDDIGATMALFGCFVAWASGLLWRDR